MRHVPPYRNRRIERIVKDAFAKEGRIEGDHVVVPADFFTRLNAMLNPKPRTSILDMLLEDEDRKH